MSEAKRELLITEIGTKDVVERVDVTGMSERQVERVLRGMLTNMDTDRFFVADSAQPRTT